MHGSYLGCHRIFGTSNIWQLVCWSSSTYHLFNSNPIHSYHQPTSKGIYIYMCTMTVLKWSESVEWLGDTIYAPFICEVYKRSLVIDKVNWLHYLNYEVISCSLIGCYFLRLGGVIQSDRHVIQSYLHVTSTSYSQMFTSQLVSLMVSTFVIHQNIIAQLWGWDLAYEFTCIGM